jgi:hypothetical protein
MYRSALLNLITRFVSRDYMQWRLYRFVFVTRSTTVPRSLTLAVSTALLLLGASEAGAQSGTFRRGDANADGTIDITDVAFLIRFVFLNGEPPPCFDSADADDDGQILLTDAVRIYTYIIYGVVIEVGTPRPPPPGPISCGPDPTADEIACASYSTCDDPTELAPDSRFELVFLTPEDSHQIWDTVRDVPVSVGLCTNEPVSSWSFGVAVPPQSRPKCSIVDASLTGTRLDPRHPDTLLRQGVAHAQLVNPDLDSQGPGSVAVTQLSWHIDAVVPPSGGTGVDCTHPEPILNLTVRLQPGAALDGCTCLLHFVDGLRGGGPTAYGPPVARRHYHVRRPANNGC